MALPSVTLLDQPLVLSVAA
jgi:hypothetical protein